MIKWPIEVWTRKYTWEYYPQWNRKGNIEFTLDGFNFSSSNVKKLMSIVAMCDFNKIKIDLLSMITDVKALLDNNRNENLLNKTERKQLEKFYVVLGKYVKENYVGGEKEMDKERLRNKVAEYNALLEKANDIFNEEIRDVLNEEFGNDADDLLDSIQTLDCLFYVHDEYEKDIEMLEEMRGKK